MKIHLIIDKTRQDKTCVIIQSDFVFAKMYNSTHLQTLQILPIWDPQTFPVVMRHPTMLWWRNLFHNAFRFLHSNLFQKKHKNVFFSTYYKSFYFLWCIVSTYNLPSSLCNTSETGEGFSGPRPVVNRGDAKDLPCTWFRLKRSWEWQGYDRTKNWKRKGFWCSLTLPRGSLVDFGGRPFFVSK